MKVTSTSTKSRGEGDSLSFDIRGCVGEAELWGHVGGKESLATGGRAREPARTSPFLPFHLLTPVAKMLARSLGVKKDKRRAKGRQARGMKGTLQPSQRQRFSNGQGPGMLFFLFIPLRALILLCCNLKS